MLGLDGIGYPTAAAILCIANAQAFPVIDKWTVEGVFGATTKPQTAYKAVAYRAFAECLVAANEHYGLTSIHAVDQRVMNTVMARQELPFAPVQRPA